MDKKENEEMRGFLYFSRLHCKYLTYKTNLKIKYARNTHSQNALLLLRYFLDQIFSFCGMATCRTLLPGIHPWPQAP